jgi:hypothetical protein
MKNKLQKLLPIAILLFGLILANSCKKDDDNNNNNSNNVASNPLLGKWGIAQIITKKYTNGILSDSINQKFNSTDSTYINIETRTDRVGFYSQRLSQFYPMPDKRFLCRESAHRSYYFRHLCRQIRHLPVDPADDGFLPQSIADRRSDLQKSRTSSDLQ